MPSPLESRYLKCSAILSSISLWILFPYRDLADVPQQGGGTEFLELRYAGIEHVSARTRTVVALVLDCSSGGGRVVFGRFAMRDLEGHSHFLLK